MLDILFLKIARHNKGFLLITFGIFPSYWLMNAIDHLVHVSATQMDYALVNRNLLLAGVKITTFLLTLILRPEQSKNR